MRKGARQEKVYDVAWSGDRKPGADGKLPAVGNTVDVANATYTNTIGAPQLSAVWKDPDFDPGLRAVYYVRVLEIPTPRWTAYDAKRFNVKMPKEVRMIDAGARLYVADLVHAGDLRAVRSALPEHAADFPVSARYPEDSCRTDTKLRWRRWPWWPFHTPLPPSRVRTNSRRNWPILSPP